MNEIDELTGLPCDDIEPNVPANSGEARTPSEAIEAAVYQVEVKTRRDGKPIGHKPLPFDVEVTTSPNEKPTPRMIAMANFIVDGLSPPDAYRKAYNADKSCDETVKAEANKIMRDQRFTLLLQSLTEARIKMVIDDELSVRKFVMTELFKHAKEADGTGHKLKALELMGKSAGLFNENTGGDSDALDVGKLKAELKAKLDVLLATDVTPRMVQ